MAIFNNMSITNKGQALYAKVQAGIELKFTKMMVGSGDIDARNPATLLDLIEPKYTVGIQSMTPNSEAKTALISGTIDNRDMTEAVYICEIGLYAQDPDEGEILYAYGTAGKYGDYYAPASRGPFSWNYQINAAIGNAANISIILSNLTYDYGISNTNTTFLVISGATQKELNKSIDTNLNKINTSLNDMMYETAGGTGTAITLSMQPLKQGYNKTFIASANNNGAATTINGKNLYKPGTTTSPKLIEGKAYTVWYNSVGDCFFIKASAEGTVTSSHVLAGYTFSNDDDTGLLGTLDLSKLISENIRSGVTINGITGHPHVVNTGDAVLDPQFLLTGYSGYDDGVKKNGTMPNLSGNWQTAAFRGNSGNGVLAQIPRGYSDGGTNTYTYCVDSNFIASNIIAGKNIFGVAGTARPILNYAEGSYTFGASYNNLYLDLGVIPISYDFIYGVLNVDFINVMNSSVVKTDTKEVLIFPWNGAIYSMYPKYQTAATDSGSPAFALRNEYNNTVPLVNANYSTGNTNCKVQGTFTWKAYKLK